MSMNLQVCVPYEKCPFNCPMCIASGRKQYHNLYGKNKEGYFRRLEETLNYHKINDIVLTGNTDPTLNTHWLSNTINAIRKISNDIGIELQTKNYNLKGYRLKGLDTLAYSIPDLKSYLRAWNFRKIEGNNRLVILLTKDFKILNTENFNPMGYNQITFKVLQYGQDEKANKWVDDNKLENLKNIYEIVNKYNGTDISVRIDTNCQESQGRYLVFRENGKIYESWEDSTE